MKDKPSGRWNHLLREIPSPQIKSPDLFEELATDPSPVPIEASTLSSNPVLSVTDLNKQIKEQIEGEFVSVWVQGEISNFKAHTSGHHYFSLKDQNSQISAVMFKGYNSKLRFRPDNGMEVIVRGKVTVYEPRGSYQIFCESMEPIGAGALQQAYEQLKAKLQKEGLFATTHKKSLPPYPLRIGVVTSPTGAAIQDILNVLSRRSRRLQVVVIPARVQGEGAAQEVVRGIKLANHVGGFDVLIVGRGGGSIEDLWCFNEEIVAREIFASKIPIISAVGHEIDFTIADFVADLRAPTPSAAAEIVAKSEQELLDRLDFFHKALRLLIQQKISDTQSRFKNIKSRLRDPRSYLQDCVLRLDDWSQRLFTAQQKRLDRWKLLLQLTSQKLKSPQLSIQQRQAYLSNQFRWLVVSQQKKQQNQRQRLESLMGLLDSLSPLKVVERGYAIVREQDEVLQSVKSWQGGSLEIQLRDGEIEVQVLHVKSKES